MRLSGMSIFLKTSRDGRSYCDDVAETDRPMSRKYLDLHTKASDLTDEVSQSRFEIYRDFAGRYRWRLRGREHRIAADSPRSYSSPDLAREAARTAKIEARGARISSRDE
jgi:uncharacterized protein YegP (UPF0339 family)